VNSVMIAEISKAGEFNPAEIKECNWSFCL